jgi:hypothetical protein
MYQGMPKEVVGETEGTSEKSFLGFNGMLYVVFDAPRCTGGGTVTKAIKATPSMLQEEDDRPAFAEGAPRAGVH